MGKRFDRNWVHGYTVAVAEMTRILRNDSTARETLRAAGITLQLAVRAGVEPFDLSVLEGLWSPPAAREAKRRRLQ